MIITDINAQKRKGRYNIYVDGTFYSGVDAETIIKAGLKVGKEVDKQTLEDVVLESETRSAFEKLLGLVSRQMYSRRDLEKKLFQYGYSAECVQRVIAKAEEYGYINDDLYAKLLVESKSLKSKKEVKNALFLKGISSSIIDEKVQVIDREEEKNRAQIIAQKYMKNKQVDEKTMAGLYAYLARRGFAGDSISFVLRNYKFEGGNVNDWD